MGKSKKKNNYKTRRNEEKRKHQNGLDSLFEIERKLKDRCNSQDGDEKIQKLFLGFECEDIRERFVAWRSEKIEKFGEENFRAINNMLLLKLSGRTWRNLTDLFVFDTMLASGCKQELAYLANPGHTNGHKWESPEAEEWILDNALQRSEAPVYTEEYSILNKEEGDDFIYLTCIDRIGLGYIQYKEGLVLDSMRSISVLSDVGEKLGEVMKKERAQVEALFFAAYSSIADSALEELRTLDAEEKAASYRTRQGCAEQMVKLNISQKLVAVFPGTIMNGEDKLINSSYEFYNKDCGPNECAFFHMLISTFIVMPKEIQTCFGLILGALSTSIIRSIIIDKECTSTVEAFECYCTASRLIPPLSLITTALKDERRKYTAHIKSLQQPKENKSTEIVSLNRKNEALEAENQKLKRKLRLMEYAKEQAEATLDDCLAKLDDCTSANEEMGEDDVITLEDETEAMHEVETADVNFPYHTDRKVVIYGGHPTWVKEMKKRFPDCTFQTGRNAYNYEPVSQADILIMQINAMSHPVYHSIKDIAAKNGIPYVHINAAGVNRSSVELIEAIETTLGK